MTTVTKRTLSIAELSGADAAGQALIEVAQRNPDLWVVTADVMHSTKTEPFALAFPDRFVNCGVAEQTMVGVAAGLAVSGKTVFAAAFAAMLTMRACEQIRTDVAYPNLNVKFIATHAGFALGAGGTTHHSTEDISIMRSMANMTVIVPCDAREARAAVLAAIAQPGPVYLRFGRARDPIVYHETPSYKIGQAIKIRDGTDATLIGCGRTVAECLLAAEMLADHGLNVRVLDMHTIKPIDQAAVEEAAAQTRMIFTVEEHSTVAGLGGAVAEVVAGMRGGAPLERLGVPDIYASIGGQDALLTKYGLTADPLCARVLSALC